MTRYVCAKCGAEAMTISPDGNTLPGDDETVVDHVTHCSNRECEKSDPSRATAADFMPAEEWASKA
ncbi:hypothetical protein [Leucobacter tenebrionis]|uniref:hypothetical protein n=1 Tax=Leucobacter tenebrionis TaxID=2873270 RepID=UPI001CA78446|nr:hypothetical protein [Leucobacter tenebrionis]QZY51784.1 hypothetical protein KVY00_14700 [Leucobacter tenebrionis]